MEISEQSSLEAYIVPSRPAWIRPEEYPYVGKIVAIEPIKGKYGTDFRFTLENDKGQQRQFDCWGSNQQTLSKAISARVAEWIGTTVMIDANVVNGKTVKVLHVVIQQGKTS